MEYQQTFTITFGDQAENGVGMQKIGEMSEYGFSFKDIDSAGKWFNKKGINTEIYDLGSYLPEEYDKQEAYLLVARNGASTIIDVDEFYEEQSVLDKDSKAKIYGRLVNKLARHNLCFGEEAQDPEYEEGKGTIIAFSDVPLLNKMRKKIGKIFSGDIAKNLLAEGNYYYDLKKCGIGFHGDAERKKVVAIRVGASMPLHYQWFYQSKPVGERIEIVLDHGDMYVMSEKAVGYDWKKKKIPTMRHAAGAKKYLTIKEKK